MSLRVAVSASAGAPADPDTAVAVAERCLAAAAAADARLLVLPQLFLSGGRLGSAPAAAMLSDGPPVRGLAAAARRHRVALACGYLERCSGRFHDSALFVDDRGCALANYRRTHLAAPDPEWLAPGQWLNQVSFAGARLGLLLGTDLEAPEPARALALAGTAILLLPADLGPEAVAVTAALLRARAFENGCAMVFANLSPAPGAPPSLILGPDGTVLAKAASAGLAVADLPTLALPEAARRMAARRPTLYRRLTAPHPPIDGPRS